MPKKKKAKLIVCGSTETKTGKPCKRKFKKGNGCPSHHNKNEGLQSDLPEDSSDGILYSITDLARKFKVDRATIREKLLDIEPKKTEGRTKLYDLDEVEDILNRDEYDFARTRKLQAEADTKELELKIKIGKYASIEEFKNVTQKLFGKLHKKCCIQIPRAIASRLLQAENTAEILEILTQEYGHEFDNLRADFSKYL